MPSRLYVPSPSNALGELMRQIGKLAPKGTRIDMNTSAAGAEIRITKPKTDLTAESKFSLTGRDLADTASNGFRDRALWKFLTSSDGKPSRKTPKARA